MKIVTIDEAQTQLPALLAAVEATGEPVLICHQGKPVADSEAVRKGVWHAAMKIASPSCSTVQKARQFSWVQAPFLTGS